MSMRPIPVALAAAIALAPVQAAWAACDCEAEQPRELVSGPANLPAPPSPHRVEAKREFIQLEGLGHQAAVRLDKTAAPSQVLSPRLEWEAATAPPPSHGGDSQTFLIAQAPAAGSPAATSDTLIPIEIEAQVIDVKEGPGSYVEASGSVKVTYEGIEVAADYLRFDRDTMRGMAQGNVKLDRGVYHLRAKSIAFDLTQRVANARDWQAWIERQGWFGGAKLHLSDALVYSEDARVSPCLHEDPGYWISGERLEWYPKSQYWNLRGNWVSVVVGGVPVFIIPFFVASIGEEASKARLRLPDTRIDANVGFDGAQGLFVDSRAPYSLGKDLPGAIPVRVMQDRGISAGVVQDFPAGIAQGKFDANYTQYWPWLDADPNRQGPHANVALTRDWAGGARTLFSLGYRVDVGRRSDAEYQVDPGGYPVHRLPEITTTWPSWSLGPLSLSPSVRGAYLHEVPTDRSSGILQGGLGFGLPTWHPNDFWETSFYGGANSAYYLGDRSQSVLFAGTGSSQRWAPWLSTSFRFETQPVYTTGGGTPFDHDKATAVDRFFLNADWRIYGPWSLGVGAFWAREYDKPFAPESFKRGDLAVSIRYTVNCLGFGVTFRPEYNGRPFQYTFDYQVITF
ncbi:MAG TPA: hypothetical protein V6D05_17235 [Stenomitos sp.]